MEYNSDMGGGLPPPNGHAPAAEPEPAAVLTPAPAEPSGARVDAARGVFITSSGNELVLSGKAINSLVIERVAREGKPRIPMVEVTLLGKQKQLEANPNDPNYQAALAEWQEEASLKTMRYLFTVGVKGQPDEAFIEEHRPFLPSATDLEMKYLWVASQLPDDDIPLFMEAIQGQTRPTEKGIEQVADSFQRPGERLSD